MRHYYTLRWRERIPGHGTVRYESHIREFGDDQYETMIELYNQLKSDRSRYPIASMWEVTQIG